MLLKGGSYGVDNMDIFIIEACRGKGLAVAEWWSGLCSVLVLAVMGAGMALLLSAVAPGPPAVGGD